MCDKNKRLDTLSVSMGFLGWEDEVTRAISCLLGVDLFIFQNFKDSELSSADTHLPFCLKVL